MAGVYQCGPAGVDVVKLILLKDCSLPGILSCKQTLTTRIFKIICVTKVCINSSCSFGWSRIWFGCLLLASYSPDLSDNLLGSGVNVELVQGNLQVIVKHGVSLIIDIVTPLINQAVQNVLIPYSALHFIEGIPPATLLELAELLVLVPRVPQDLGAASQLIEVDLGQDGGQARVRRGGDERIRGSHPAPGLAAHQA